MRSFVRLLVTAGVFAAAAAPASANVECVLPVGPGGTDMRLTLTVAACPAPGEAIPRAWIVDAQPTGDVAGDTGSAPAAAAGRATAKPVVQARVIHDVPARAARAAHVPQAAVDAVALTRPLAAPATAPGERAASGTAAGSSDVVAGDGSLGTAGAVPMWMLAALALALLGAVVARPRTLVARG